MPKCIKERGRLTEACTKISTDMQSRGTDRGSQDRTLAVGNSMRGTMTKSSNFILEIHIGHIMV